MSQLIRELHLAYFDISNGGGREAYFVLANLNIVLSKAEQVLRGTAKDPQQAKCYNGRIDGRTE